MVEIALVSLLVAAEPEWETVATGAINVKARPRGESGVFEIWAEADLAAPVRDIQDTLTLMNRFPKFMPYVAEAKEVARDDDGSVYNYTHLGLPIISDRDYVVRTWVDEGVKPDGTGAFRCHWTSAHDKLPVNGSRVRVTVNEGSWDVTPKEDGKSHVVYRFAADPGGMLPTWAKNIGNRRGISGTLEAIEKEAQRRQKERAAPAP
ncbi:MAG: hypothetical protein IPJ65_35605 [Archangiaceae bacterium]|nr:hypothetical protein [Archangiaceae bacterium]